MQHCAVVPTIEGDMVMDGSDDFTICRHLHRKATRINSDTAQIARQLETTSPVYTLTTLSLLHRSFAPDTLSLTSSPSALIQLARLQDPGERFVRRSACLHGLTVEH